MESILNSEKNLAFKNKLTKTRSAKFIFREKKTNEKRLKTEKRIRKGSIGQSATHSQRVMKIAKVKNVPKKGVLTKRKGFKLKRMTTL